MYNPKNKYINIHLRVVPCPSSAVLTRFFS
jgi:hypothetical protein